MGEQTKIEWTRHTFNHVWGCTKVAAECKHCYAERMAARFHGSVWGPQGKRRVTSAANWAEPLKWDRQAAREGVPCTVFCASMADVFEDDHACFGGEDRGLVTLNDVRARLWALIEATPHLVWLLLTKRPHNIRAMVPRAWLSSWPGHVWTGTSAGCQASADKLIPHLLRVPGRHFLSCEPMLGPVDLSAVKQEVSPGFFGDCLQWYHRGKCHVDEGLSYPRIHWVICGGESGPGARPMHPDWARGLREQCVGARVPFFFKQWGEFCPEEIAPAHTFKDKCLVSTTGKTHPRMSAIPLNTICEPMARVGKRAAGRLLDGRTWDELPVEFTAPIEVAQ